MARLFKPTFTKPIPEGAELFTRRGKKYARFKTKRGKTREAELTEDGTRIRQESKVWRGEYYDPATDRTVTTSLCTDQTAAALKLAELVKKAELRGAGVRDPFEEHTKRPLVD